MRIPAGPGRRVLPADAPSLMTGMAPGAATGAALQQLGQVGVNFGADMLARETRQDVEAKEKADRSTAAVRVGESRIQLQQGMQSLTDRVLAGEVDEKQAQSVWSQTRDGVLSKATADLPGDLAQSIGQTVNLQADELAGLHLSGAFRTRNREVTRGNLTSLLEQYERDSLGDRPVGNKRAERVISLLGAAAGYGADDQVRMLQTFKEKTAYNSGVQLMDGARGSIDDLEKLRGRINTDEFADLSPDRKVMLDERIQNRQATLQHQAEVRQQRLDAARDRQLREAEHSFKAAQGVYDGGATLDDASLATLQQQVRGTPWAAAVKTLVTQGAERATFGSLSPLQQEQSLAAVRAQINAQGVSVAGMERLHRLEAIHAKTTELAEKDPLAWALQSRLIPNLPELDFSGGLQTLIPTVMAGVDAAKTTGARLGKPVSPLRPTQAGLLGELLGSLPLDQKKGAIRALAGVIPDDQQRALAGQIDGRDPTLALAMHAASLPKTSTGDPVDLILRGQDAVKAGRIKADDPGTKDDRLRMARDLNAVQWPTPKARDAAMQASSLIYDGLRDMKGSGSRSKAVELATGGLADWGDRKVPLPPGWSESRFKAGMRALTPDQVVRQAQGPLYIGGTEVAPQALLKGLPGATLIPVGPGQYAIDAGGMVVNAKRQPFVLRLGN